MAWVDSVWGGGLGWRHVAGATNNLCVEGRICVARLADSHTKYAFRACALPYQGH